MKKFNFTILIEKDEDEGFIASVPELKGCHTQGDTIVELMANIKEAIELCMEVYEKDGVDVFNKKFIEVKQLEMVM